MKKNTGFITFMVMVVVCIVAVQFSRDAGYDRALNDINIIGTDAHKVAIKAPWEDNDYWNHPQSMIYAEINNVKVHEVKHSHDLGQLDEVMVLMGGQVYSVITRRDMCKVGDIVNLFVELKYTPISKQRGYTVWMVNEMSIIEEVK